MKFALYLGAILILLSLTISATASTNQSLKITPLSDKSFYLQNQYTSLFKIEIKGKSPCSPKDQVTVAYNISKDGVMLQNDSFTKEVGCTTQSSTGSFSPQEIGNYLLCGLITNSTVNTNLNLTPSCINFEVLDTAAISCDIQLSLNLNESIFYQNGQSFKFSPELSNQSFPYQIEYWIEDLFGEIVKPKINTTNTNEKSWKTDIQEQDRVLLMKAIVYPSCSDHNLNNNIAQQMFIVTKNQSSEISSSSSLAADLEENSSLNISDINPEIASYGSMISADLQIYKGGTTKYALSMWAEKDGKIISEKTKANFKTKYSSYKLTLPLRVDPDCDRKHGDGKAQLIVEGLGVQTEKEFTLQGIERDSCAVPAPATSTSSSSSNSEYASTAKKKDYIILRDFPVQLEAGDTARIKVELFDTQDSDYEMWSYLYRGSKCYSCAAGEKDDNLISVSVKENKAKFVEMLVTVDPEMEEGEYSLAVKYKKADQKTLKSLTEKVHVKASHGETKMANQTVPLLSTLDTSPSTTSSKKIQTQERADYDGIVVYESTSQKSKNIISWTLLLAFGLLSLILALRKHSD